MGNDDIPQKLGTTVTDLDIYYKYMSSTSDGELANSPLYKYALPQTVTVKRNGEDREFLVQF